VPPVPESDLSEHIASRLDVERVLTGSGVPTVTARAAIVIGSGSTSFEVLRRISERLPVQTLPSWMRSQVQPIAVTDVVELLARCLDGPPHTAAYDVGGPERLSYAQLMQVYADVARLVRPRMPWLLPRVLDQDERAVDWAGRLAGRMSGVPGHTVSALLRSLHHDMVCLEESFLEELVPPGHRLVGARAAMERALTRPRAGVRVQDRDPMGPLPGDPPWSGGGVYLFDGEARHRPRGTVDRLLLGVRRPW
jgi:hypothetical protein